MIKLFDSYVTDIMPELFSENPHVQAIAYAIHQRMLLIQAYDAVSTILCDVDEATNDVLDALATEFRTQYYDANLDIQSKRNLIKGTLLWYMTAGTPAAMKELAESIFSDVTVTENAGQFTFRVNTTDLITETNYNAFISMIDSIKNARSLMEKFVTERDDSFQLYYGAAMGVGVTNDSQSDAPDVGNITILTDENNVGLMDDYGEVFFE